MQRPAGQAGESGIVATPASEPGSQRIRRPGPPTLFAACSNSGAITYDNRMPSPAPTVRIQFHANLNDFLAKRLRQRVFEHMIHKRPSVKDLIESLGVPHPEVDIILVEGLSVDFSHPIDGGQRIEVYPHGFRHGRDQVHNQPAVEPPPCFVLDVHLGKLAGYLRLMGFDTLYRNDYDDPELARIARQKQRILLTCDRRLLMRKQVLWGYYVRSRRPRDQIDEVMARFKLHHQRTGVAGCLECNGIIRAIDKQDILDRLQPLTRQYYDDFYQCDECHKIYWEGSHFERMRDLRQSILHAAEEP